MTLRKGLPAKLAATDADDTRYVFNNLVVCDSTGAPRAGVTSPVGVNLLTATASMNVAVAAFNGVAVRDGGAILLANDGVTNVLIDAAPASNSRLDVIYAHQGDSSDTVSTPDADDLPVLGVLKGVAAPSPVRNPAGLPDGALELGTILVPSTATATNSPGVVITQTFQHTAAAGGSVPFKTLAALQTWTSASVRQRASVFADTTANNREYVWTGSAWDSGVSTGTISPSSGYTLDPGRTRLQRSGDIVTFSIGVQIDTGTIPNYAVVATIPTGFRPTVEYNNGAILADSGSAGGLIIYGSGEILASLGTVTGTTIFRATGSWPV